LRRFNSIFLVPITLFISLAASFFIMVLAGQKESPADLPLPNYRPLYRNYHLFNEFINLPITTEPIQIKDSATLANLPPFIADLLTLSMAVNDLKEKNFPALQNSLLNVAPQHPFLIQKKNGLYLKYLYLQQNYTEFIQQNQVTPPKSLENKLFLLNCYSKTANPGAAAVIFQELFPTHPLLTLQNYISRSQLNGFLSQIDYNTWFKKLQFLAKNNRYEAFLNEKKYVNFPQLVALFQAEFDYNSKAYDKCKKSLALVTNPELAPYKKNLFLKMQCREKQYTNFFEALAELENEPAIYRDTLHNCAGILMINGETDLALQVYAKYILTTQALYFQLNTLLNRNDILIQEDNYWKALWLCAWLNYQKKDKAAAAAFFKEGIHATELSFKIANRYWLHRISPDEAKKLAVNLEHYPFTYYYTRENPGQTALAKSVFPFIQMFNHPQSPQLLTIVDILKPLVQRNLITEASDFIQWSLHEDSALSIPDKHVLKILQSILYIKQGNENMAFNRFKRNFENYNSFLLPHFLRQITFPVKYQDIVQKYSQAHGIESELLFSLIREESFFRTDVVSPAAAYGLMQLLLPTARQVALPHDVKLFQADLFNPEINIRFGTEYLKMLLDKYNGKIHLALAAYNAGDFRVDQWLSRFGDVTEDEFIEMIPFTATRTYVKNILRNYYYYRFYHGKNNGKNNH